jgi:hypothetical protein
MQIHIPIENPLGESTNLRKPGLCPDEHKAKQDTAWTTGTCKRCNSQVAAGDQILRCPSCSWWTCKNCSIAEASLWEQAHGAEKFTEVKEAKTTCAKTQQAIDAQEMTLLRQENEVKSQITLLQAKRDKAIHDLRFEGTGGAGEVQRSIAKMEAELEQGAVGMEVKRTIESLKERLKTEKAIATVQSSTATQAIKDLAKHWASFNKTVHEQRAQTEKSMEAAKKKGTTESFAKLPVLKMHLDRVQKAEEEADALKAKPKTLKAGHDILQKLEQLRLSIAGGPKTQEELAKQPIDFGVLSQRMDRDEVPSGSGPNPLFSAAPGSLLESSDDKSSADKFVVGKLTTGRPEEAAHGLPRYMGIDSNRLAFIIKDGLAAIRMEFEENGNRADVKLMRYILDEVAVEQEEMAPYGKVTRDEGHNGMKLVHFRQCPDAVKAELELAHIAALRIYTSNAYKRINDPLRNGERPHPFAATTYFLSEALKKLRAVNAQGTEAQQRKEFWRGMKVRVEHEGAPMDDL